jgi:hypothetical protein
VNVGPAQAGGTAAGTRHRQGTLIGVAPQAFRSSPEPAPAHHDDLDWELPAHVQAQADALVVPPEQPKPPAVQPHLAKTQPLGTAAPALNQAVNPAAARTEPEEPMPVEVEELPPESKPSGIGQTYKPRDQDAPPVVLTEEVQRTEAQARAYIEAQHRARSAPTVARMPAVRVGPDLAPVADEDTLVSRKSRKGLWVTLVLGAAAVIGAAGFLLMPKRSEQAEAAPPPKPEPVAVDTVAPPPPEPKPPAPPEPAPPPAESAAAAALVEPAPEAAKAKEPVGASAAKRPEAVATRTIKPKPTAPKPTGGSKSRTPAMIVRDNPF